MVEELATIAQVVDELAIAVDVGMEIPEPPE